MGKNIISREELMSREGLIYYVQAGEKMVGNIINQEELSYYIQVVRTGKNRIWWIRDDGSQQRPFTEILEDAECFGKKQEAEYLLQAYQENFPEFEFHVRTRKKITSIQIEWVNWDGK